MTKEQKKKRRLEFWTIITAVIGTIIGVGVYVKNDNKPGHVLGDVGNPIIAVLLWVFVGITVFTLMVVFLEIASATNDTGNGTVSNWTRIFINRKTASAVGLYYVFIYLPVNYGFFATIIVTYILQAAGSPVLSKGELLALYLCFGTLFVVFFSFLNCFLRDFSKMFQIVGTIIKMIPLFLVLIAFAVPDKTWGVFFQNSAQNERLVEEIGGNTWSIKLEDIHGAKIFSGFAPILFAFNGFISAANLQSETENKDMVSKTILGGVVFCCIFYVLIAIALFLGSKDGSVVSFFEYMFNGFKPLAEGQKSGAATLAGNLILAIVCLISINSYTLIGPNFFYGDVKEGIIFYNNKPLTFIKATVFQTLLGLLFLVALTILGVYQQPDNVTYYFDQAGNAGAVIGFGIYIMLLVAAMVNRKTNKVKVVKLKNWIFWTCAWFSLISMVFMIGYLFVDFCFLAVLMPTGKDWKPDWSKPISMVASFVGLGILWVANEIMLKKVPFDAEKINATYRMPKKHHFHWKRRAKVRVVEPSQIEVVEVEPQAPKKQKARKKS